MASARVNFTVGLFMTAGLALATVAIIWLGMTSFLRKGEMFVTYFDESVQGLGVDSPVKYRGVPVGRVTDIRIAPDYHLIEVVILVDDEHTGVENRFAGSVASLANVGITGAMFVEIDKAKPSTLDLAPPLSFTPEYPVIPSKPSEIKKFFSEIEQIARKIQSIDFKGISDQALATFGSLNAGIESAQIGAIASDIRTLLASLNAVADPTRLNAMAQNMDRTVLASRTLMERAATDLSRLDEILGQIQGIVNASRPHIENTLGSMASTTLKADAFMTQSTATVFQMQSSIKELQDRMTTTADNLEQTSANLNALLNNLKDQPSQLLFAQPKKPRQVEE
ncbi:MAG: MCE family protein [Desulfovibrionales bacterium]|nr:MCE family protein [Desulfovibrionales bacterium]